MKFFFFFPETGRIRFRHPELSDFFGPHRAPGGELSEFLSAYHLCAKANSLSLFAELTEVAVKLSEQRGEFSSPKQYSRNSIPLPFPKGMKGFSAPPIVHLPCMRSLLFTSGVFPSAKTVSEKFASLLCLLGSSGTKKIRGEKTWAIAFRRFFLNLAILLTSGWFPWKI